jgi:antitoxin component YwqK of YwqJK toxin-antitoxin module
MRLLFTITLLFVNAKLFACTCSIFGDFKTKDDLKSYDFIAMVKIGELPPMDSTQKFMKVRTNGNFKADVLELFKGKSTGSFSDPSFKSDCALQLQQGEEWLFFGNIYKGKMQISECSYTVQYRDIFGQRQWEYFSGIKQLDVLRKLYEHPVSSNITNKQFYPNGRIEIEQHIKNGTLNGKRIIYNIQGNIKLTEEFKNGVRTGYRRIYDTSGHLLQSTKYKKGIKKEVIRYQDTAENAWYINYQIKNNKNPLFGENEHDPAYFIKLLDSLRGIKHWDRQIKSAYVYSDNGLSYKMIYYGYKGNLEAEGYQDWKTKINERRIYYRNGKLETYMRYDQINDLQTEYDYKKDGSKKDFISKCKSCKFYFDIKQPAGAPEEVFIQ